MNKYTVSRECPNGWGKCYDCIHERDCIAGLYLGEEDNTAIIKAAEICEQVTHKETVESVKRLKSMHEEFMQLTTDAFMDRFYGYRVHGLHHVEVMPLDGPTAPGGSSSKSRKKKLKKKVPEYLKEFAH